MGQKTESIFERGKDFFETGNNEQALRLFNQVLNREPGHKGALRHKALLVTAEDDPKKAENFLNIAISQQPKDDELQQVTGSFYIKIKKFDQAEQHLKRSIELNEHNALAHYGLGIICARHHSDHSQAIAHFNQAIEYDAEFTDALFNRGCSYMIEGKMDKAKQDFLKARQLNHPRAEEILDNGLCG